MSAEVLKQLKIKTSTVRRLKKEYISYEKEAKQIADKLGALEAQAPTEDSKYEAKKQVRVQALRKSS